MAGIHPTTAPFPSQPFHFQLNTPETGNLLQTAAEASLQVSQLLKNDAGHPSLVHLLTITCYRKKDGDLVTEIALDPDARGRLMFADRNSSTTTSSKTLVGHGSPARQQDRNRKLGKDAKVKKMAKTRSGKATSGPEAKTQETWDSLTVEKRKEFLTMLEGLTGAPLP